MKKPLIGLTPSHNIDTDEIHMGPLYPRAIRMAGGIPIILPLEPDSGELRQTVEGLDGILFTGGPDPHPFLFGEETLSGCGEISVKRDAMETELLELAIEYEKPVLGICRGIQIINVGLGGDIYQDLYSQTERSMPIAHKQPPLCYGPSHTVTVTPGSMLADICRSALCSSSSASPQMFLKVNSSHHQAVRRLAPGLSVCATAPDGIIEGLEMEGYPFLLGVQWHPEYLWKNDPTAAAIFKAFVAACRSK